MNAQAHRPSTLEAPSYSRLARLHACRRAYYYGYVMRLRPRGGDAVRQAAGRALHAALECAPGDPAADAAIEAAMQGVDYAPEPQQAYLTAAHLQGVLRGYNERWRPDGEDADWTPLSVTDAELRATGALIAMEAGSGAVERSMTVRLTERLVMTLVIDAVVRRRADDAIMIVDHKATAAYLGRGVQQRQAVGHQLPLYVAAARALGLDAQGAIVNAIYMGEHALKATSSATKFDRYAFDYTDGQIAEAVEWAEASQSVARQDEARWGARGDARLWLQAPGAQCAFCDYRQLCEIAPAMRQRRIEAAYTMEEGE